MGLEPRDRQPRDGLERARLFEEMGCSVDHGDPALARQAGGRVFIEAKDLEIVAAHDEQRRAVYGSEARPGEIRTAAARHHCGDVGSLGRGPERGATTGAGTEVSERNVRELGLGAKPTRRGSEPMREKFDVEDERTIRSFFLSEEVEEQGSDARLSQGGGHRLIATTVSRAATAVSKEHDADGGGGNREVAFERDTFDRNLHLGGVSGNEIRRCIVVRGLGSSCGEQLRDFRVGSRIEIAVPAAYRGERSGREEGENRVGTRIELELRLRLRRTDRHGNDDPTGAQSVDDLDGRAHGAPGSDAVVDDDDRAILHRNARTRAAKEPESTFDRVALDAFQDLQFAFTNSGSPDDVLVEDANAALADGTDSKLGMRGQTELADDDDVERGIEQTGDLGRDRNPTARQAEDNRVLGAQTLQSLSQEPTGLAPILKSRPLLQHEPSFRQSSGKIQGRKSPARRAGVT